MKPPIASGTPRRPLSSLAAKILAFMGALFLSMGVATAAQAADTTPATPEAISSFLEDCQKQSYAFCKDDGVELKAETKLSGELDGIASGIAIGAPTEETTSESWQSLAEEVAKSTETENFVLIVDQPNDNPDGVYLAGFGGSREGLQASIAAALKDEPDGSVAVIGANIRGIMAVDPENTFEGYVGEMLESVIDLMMRLFPYMMIPLILVVIVKHFNYLAPGRGYSYSSSASRSYESGESKKLRLAEEAKAKEILEEERRRAAKAQVKKEKQEALREAADKLQKEKEFAGQEAADRAKQIVGISAGTRREYEIFAATAVRYGESSNGDLQVASKKAKKLLERLDTLYERAGRLSSESLISNLNRSYAKSIKNLNKVFSENYFEEIALDGELWRNSKAKIARALGILDRFEIQVLRNIQQINESRELEFEVALDRLIQEGADDVETAYGRGV